MSVFFFRGTHKLHLPGGDLCFSNDFPRFKIAMEPTHIFVASKQPVNLFKRSLHHLGLMEKKKTRHEEGLHVPGTIAPLGQGVANTSFQQHLLDRDCQPLWKMWDPTLQLSFPQAPSRFKFCKAKTKGFWRSFHSGLAISKWTDQWVGALIASSQRDHLEGLHFARTREMKKDCSFTS